MWLTGFLILALGEVIWLGNIMSNKIQKDFKSHISIINGKTQINIKIGVLTWIIITLGITYFASFQSQSISQAIFFGAFFGFVLYTCYECTNLTFFNNYPKDFALLDIIWGIIICSIISLSGYLVRHTLI